MRDRKTLLNTALLALGMLSEQNSTTVEHMLMLT
jgi:hypothetical protein